MQFGVTAGVSSEPDARTVGSYSEPPRRNSAPRVDTVLQEPYNKRVQFARGARRTAVSLRSTSAADANRYAMRNREVRITQLGLTGAVA
jgi:hypothetical protein